MSFPQLFAGALVEAEHMQAILSNTATGSDQHAARYHNRTRYAAPGKSACQAKFSELDQLMGQCSEVAAPLPPGPRNCVHSLLVALVVRRQPSSSDEI
ncbi:MAG: hypothetical protein R3C56_25640 [Pirellulaceae bacterium]